jgi:hypothetical protein
MSQKNLREITGNRTTDFKNVSIKKLHDFSCGAQNEHFGSKILVNRVTHYMDDP